MPLLHIPASLHPFQVDGFPPGATRSCEGALHFHPSSTKLVTLDEWAFISTSPYCKEVAQKIRVTAATEDDLAPVSELVPDPDA